MSKRLVKNELSTPKWNLLKYLKTNAVGFDNAIQGWELSRDLGIPITTLRAYIRDLRKHQDVIVGSDIKKGYYIPLRVEKEQALKYAENKTLSELETRARQNPQFVLKAFKRLNEVVKTLDGAVQGQIKMQLSGYENELVNYYGDKYVIEEVKPMFKIGDRVRSTFLNGTSTILNVEIEDDMIYYSLHNSSIRWFENELELVE